MGAQAIEYAGAAPSPLAAVDAPSEAAAVAGRLLSAAFECLHDLAHPVAALAAMRRLAGGLGTVLRPATVHEYASQAGYARVDILPVDHDLWRFYHLHP